MSWGKQGRGMELRRMMEVPTSLPVVNNLDADQDLPKLSLGDDALLGIRLEECDQFSTRIAGDMDLIFSEWLLRQESVVGV